MTISKDRVKPSPHPDSWKLPEIFITGIVYGTYLAVMTVLFFWAMRSTDFFTVSKQSNKQIQRILKNLLIHCSDRIQIEFGCVRRARSM